MGWRKPLIAVSILILAAGLISAIGRQITPGGTDAFNLGVDFQGGRYIGSMKQLLAEGWDAVFVGCGAPRGRNLEIPGRQEAAANIHVGLDWLASVYFGHVTQVKKRVIVLGGGNTANLLAIWRVHGFDAILREAWEAGVVLCGWSAGMICWFEAGDRKSVV